MRKEVIGAAELYLGDCRDILPTLPKVDAVITDPPYGKVKGDFDHEWGNRLSMMADARSWLDSILPVMKDNATLWWFAWPSLAGRIESMIGERMNVLSHVVWEKPSGTGHKCEKEALRAPMPVTERIIMADLHGSDEIASAAAGYDEKCDEAARNVFGHYITASRAKNGLTMKDLTEVVGAYGNVNHGGACSNWEKGYNTPTEDQYTKLQAAYPSCFTRDYSDLKQEYQDLKQEYQALRRWFDCRAGDQFGDIWRFNPCRDNWGHPTPKPVPLMEYMVRLSVRPDGTVCDPFMGSGTTGVACMNLGRQFIGIEREPKYFDIACRRIDDAQRQGRLIG
jgi:adenine-specific DNA-methyltransferase